MCIRDRWICMYLVSGTSVQYCYWSTQYEINWSMHQEMKLINWTFELAFYYSYFSLLNLCSALKIRFHSSAYRKATKKNLLTLPFSVLSIDIVLLGKNCHVMRHLVGPMVCIDHKFFTEVDLVIVIFSVCMSWVSVPCKSWSPHDLLFGRLSNLEAFV